MADASVQGIGMAGAVPRISIGAGGPGGSIMAVAVVAVVAMMIIPMPTVMLDALMALNLLFSLLVLLLVLYIRKATDFMTFPTILLVATVFGLALNVSSTKLILSKGANFDGRMIRAFSTFVVGSGNKEGLAIGFVIFIIILAVQIIVITKGASRISEVTARFRLDSMGPDQMAIETKLSNGYITAEQAQVMSAELDKEKDFYSRMDGATKFINGNVQVGILITAVNILGGIIIGMAIHGEPLASAAGNYVGFAVGDGLMTQLPALLISTATAIMMTRSVSDKTLNEDIAEQFKQRPRIYLIGGFVLLVCAFLPGFPWYVLIPLAALMFFTFFRLRSDQQKVSPAAAAAKAAEKTKKPETEELPVVVPLDAISLEIGYALVSLVNKNDGDDLLPRLKQIRREMGMELGLVIPKIRILDSLMLEPSGYCFKIKGVNVGTGKLRVGSYLCINSGSVTHEIHGEKTVDPAFGMPAVWISESQRDEAERAGYTLVDASTVIATHLQVIIRSHAAELLGYQETKNILEELAKNYPAVVEAVNPPHASAQQPGLSLGVIQKVLQGLLREQVSIRNLVTIMETLADWGPTTREVPFLVEKCRQALAAQICYQYADSENKHIRVLTIDPALEKIIIESQVENGAGEAVAAMEPEQFKAWMQALTRAVTAVKQQNWLPVILCSEAARRLVRYYCERELPQVAVLSVHEINPEFKVDQVGVIK